MGSLAFAFRDMLKLLPQEGDNIEHSILIVESVIKT